MADAGRGDDDVLESAGGAGDDTMETAMTPTIERIVHAVVDPAAATASSAALVT